MTKFQLIPLSLNEGREAVKFCNDATRIPTLLDISWRMETRDWLTLLGEEWESCDNIGLFRDELLESPFANLIEAPLEWRDA